MDYPIFKRGIIEGPICQSAQASGWAVAESLSTSHSELGARGADHIHPAVLNPGLANPESMSRDRIGKYSGLRPSSIEHPSLFDK